MPTFEISVFNGADQISRHLLHCVCLLCNKVEKFYTDKRTKKRYLQHLNLCVTIQGGKLLMAATVKRNESLLLQICDKNLVAVKARYYLSCFRSYTSFLTTTVRKENDDTVVQNFERL